MCVSAGECESVYVCVLAVVGGPGRWSSGCNIVGPKRFSPLSQCVHVTACQCVYVCSRVYPCVLGYECSADEVQQRRVC